MSDSVRYLENRVYDLSSKIENLEDLRQMDREEIRRLEAEIVRLKEQLLEEQDHE